MMTQRVTGVQWSSTAVGNGYNCAFDRTGKLDRYEKFGEIREGWLADLLLFEGDPFEDISILERPDDSLAVIMKDGKLHKQ